MDRTAGEPLSPAVARQAPGIAQAPGLRAQVVVIPTIPQTASNAR